MPRPLMPTHIVSSENKCKCAVMWARTRLRTKRAGLAAHKTPRLLMADSGVAGLRFPAATLPRDQPHGARTSRAILSARTDRMRQWTQPLAATDSSGEAHGSQHLPRGGARHQQVIQQSVPRGRQDFAAEEIKLALSDPPIRDSSTAR